VDLTTLIYGAVVVLGLMGADIALYSGSVVVEIPPPPKTATIDIDEQAVQAELSGLLSEVSSQNSVVDPPDIKWSRQQGAGLALATTLNLDRFAYALQIELGVSRDRLRISLVLDHETVGALVDGSSNHSGQFGQAFAPEKGESLLAFVRRCGLWGVSQIAPYSTALYLLKMHSTDKDFTELIALAEHSETVLPPTPISRERSLFDNLLGLVALFKNDLKDAGTEFAKAMAADPTNSVPFINAAFVDLESGDYQMAASRMDQLLRLAPPDNDVLIASAYMTWAAALMGLHDLEGADRLLAAATQVDTDSATAFGLWAEEKRLEGDTNAADQLDRRALEKTAAFQNYAEVAALYFHPAWEKDQSLELNKFFNPNIVPFH
jgi:tetratricopeptide (TPR) repeat protein